MKLEARLQRAPTDEEMAAELAVTVEDFHDALLQISNSTIVALDELWNVSDSSGDQVSLLDTLPDRGAPDPQALVDQCELRDRIADAIAALPEREKLVVAPVLLREPDPARDRRGARRDRVTRLAAAHQGRAAAALEAGRRTRIAGAHARRLRGRMRPRGVAHARPLHARYRRCFGAQREETGMHKPADRIRNVALVGHRGSGKTSLHEALLFQAGATNRLGSVIDGTTVSDTDPDEKSRQMSISAALSSFQWQERKVNLIDTPGDSSFIADALGVLRVCESAVFVVNAVMGVEVHTTRLWQRAAELDLARLVFVNMLDRERADFFRTLESLKSAFGPHVVATEIPIGSEHEISGVIDLVDMKAYRYEGAEPRELHRDPDPRRAPAQAEEYREKLMDEVSESSDALMERYLEGEEISHEEIVAALKDGTDQGVMFPVTCGVATRNLATNRLLDAIVEDLPSPVKHGGLEVGGMTLEPVEDKELFAYVFKTRADPFAGRINLFRVYQGVLKQDSQVLNTRTHTKERIGQLVTFEGRQTGPHRRVRTRRHRRRGQAQGDEGRRLAGGAR